MGAARLLIVVLTVEAFAPAFSAPAENAQVDQGKDLFARRLQRLPCSGHRHGRSPAAWGLWAHCSRGSRVRIFGFAQKVEASVG